MKKDVENQKPNAAEGQSVATKSEATNALTKKKYSRPEVVPYGTLESVTHSGGSGSSDFLGMQGAMN